MKLRPLPADLVAVLRRAREVEAAATTRVQQLDAVRATTTLVVAAQQEGWSTAELAEGLEMNQKTLARRLREHRRRWHGGLSVTPAPPKRIDPPLVPLEQREWLTLSEAMMVTRLSESGISQWRVGGLLPSTRPRRYGDRRYSRTDLERVLAADERDGRGVRWAELRARIDAS